MVPSSGPVPSTGPDVCPYTATEETCTAWRTPARAAALQRVASALDVDCVNRGPIPTAVDASGTVDRPTTSLDPFGQLAGVVAEVSLSKLAPQFLQETRVGLAPMQGHYCVAVIDQPLGDVGAEKAGGACKKNGGRLRWGQSPIAQVVQSFRPSASALICISGNIGLWSRYSSRSLPVSVSNASNQRW